MCSTAPVAGFQYSEVDKWSALLGLACNLTTRLFMGKREGERGRVGERERERESEEEIREVRKVRG